MLLDVELGEVCGTDVHLRAGRVVIVGRYTDRHDLPFNPRSDLNRKHLDLRGAWGSGDSHFHRAARIMANAERPRPWTRLALVTDGLAADQALDDVAQGKVIEALIDPRANTNGEAG